MEKIKSNPIAEFTHPAPLHTPVLFLVFNRPDTTRQVFDAIRQAQPPRLYVAADGPRADREGEAERCQQVRDIATQVDWDCEVKTLFREENLGCRVAVSGAIDWFFENEEMGIILEDDCLPSPSWFPFAQELLDRYREDERIMCIAASHFHGNAHQPSHSYFFSIYNHCWGWASWRRAWQHYDHEMEHWPELRETPWLRGVGNGNRLFERSWRDIFDRCYAEKIDSWAYRWTFSCWSQSGLTALPAKNLIKNIGFGEDSTHTTEDHSYFDSLEELAFPLTHPKLIQADILADQWTQRNIFRESMKEKIQRTLYRITQRMLSLNGLEIRKKTQKIVNANPNHLEVFEIVSDYTMTSAERVVNLCESIEYLERHKISGDIVECGVWRGGSAMAIAMTLMRLNSSSRTIHLFDTFEGMSTPTKKDVTYFGSSADSLLKKEKNRTTKASIWCEASIEDVLQNMHTSGYPSEKIKTYKGKVEHTLPEHAPDRIALLRLDTDWYESTYHELKNLFPKLVDGGILIIDDYGYWKGAKDAVDQYFFESKERIFLQRIDNTGRTGVKF